MRWLERCRFRVDYSVEHRFHVFCKSRSSVDGIWIVLRYCAVHLNLAYWSLKMVVHPSLLGVQACQYLQDAGVVQIFGCMRESVARILSEPIYFE
jgi:hypothetical protein